MFVKWECGCKGILLEDPVMTIVIEPCDNDCWNNRYDFFDRELVGESAKTYIKLTPMETEKLMKAVQNLMYDGFKLRTIQSLLG